MAVVTGDLVELVPLVQEINNRIRASVQNAISLTAGNVPNQVSYNFSYGGLPYPLSGLNANSGQLIRIRDVLIYMGAIITAYSNNRKVTIEHFEGQYTNGDTPWYKVVDTWHGVGALNSGFNNYIGPEAFNELEALQGQLITPNFLEQCVNAAYNQWNSLSREYFSYRTCHDNCHGSCHGSKHW